MYICNTYICFILTGMGPCQGSRLRGSSSHILAAAGRRLLCTRRQLLASVPEPLTAKELTVPVETPDGTATRMLDVFIVRDADHGVRAFENHCPHAGGPLNLLPDGFLSPDKDHILCCRHGARFNLMDGLCVQGPGDTMGKTLHELPISVCAESGGVTTSEEALDALCRTGGGAYYLIEKETPSEGSPAVPKNCSSMSSSTRGAEPEGGRGKTARRERLQRERTRAGVGARTR